MSHWGNTAGEERVTKLYQFFSDPYMEKKKGKQKRSVHRDKDGGDSCQKKNEKKQKGTN